MHEKLKALIGADVSVVFLASSTSTVEIGGVQTPSPTDAYRGKIIEVYDDGVMLTWQQKGTIIPFSAIKRINLL